MFRVRTYRSEGKQFQYSLSSKHEGKYCVEHVKNFPIQWGFPIILITKQKQKKITFSTLYLFAGKKCHEQMLWNFHLVIVKKLCRVHLHTTMAWSNISHLSFNSNWKVLLSTNGMHSSQFTSSLIYLYYSFYFQNSDVRNWFRIFFHYSPGFVTSCFVTNSS